ncbi:MAG: DUF547 domain-containing protein [Vicinamibacterales bacterium]|jgi:hypothetical protein|nr:hypothetical protein [Acidobacteriota bacterium]MDP6374199.1 DUF547 domain-containing protein [Vicinamibacterales bacterium]MDP6608660.1 DUF547 domain-containing protein [Vicinamibacterales bacterium]HAK56236.1 hypothetical protein [Acidobacteriota bacterium]
MRRRWMLVSLIAVSLGAALAGQTAVGHSRLDAILDIYVRDGRVYYRALRLERSSLDRYVASLDVAVDALPREEQAAFWLNAYNALVLRTVVDRYPIRGAAPQYPPGSIRQIPGAFDGRRFSVGGRNVTLDEIEAQLTEFGDPRLLLALGRGALGSPRLRSEAFRPDRLEQQLQAVVTDFVATEQQVNVDGSDGRLRVSPILGWRAPSFIAAYADESAAPGARSPVERATLVLIGPHLLPREREFIAADEFVMEYLDFDWRLNDLTGF